MKVLCDCGRSGNAEKIMMQDHDKKLNGGYLNEIL